MSFDLRGIIASMLTYQILEDENILVIEPMASLSKEDLDALTKDVDMHLLRTGVLNGILIHASKFPGWESIGSMLAYFRFLREYHHSFKKVALVSDSLIASIMPRFMRYCASVEVKGFAFDEKVKAMAWLRDSN